MNAILAFSLIALMMLCGALDKMKQGSEDAPPNVSQAPVKSSPKQDKDSLRAELVQIEEEMSQAVVDGDITMLAKNTTDDFKLTDVNGKVQNKNEALADVKKEKNIKAFSITEAELLSFSEDSAVLSYTQNITLKNGRSGKLRVTDSFVKKDGRWLVKSEQATFVRK